MASLLSGLDAYGVNLKVVDVLFEGAQDPAQDQKLADALKAGAPTVIAQLFALSPDSQVKSGTLAGALPLAANSAVCGPSAASPFTQAYGFMGVQPLMAQSSASVGHITPIVDADGNIRRVPAIVCFEGQAYPALAVAGVNAMVEIKNPQRSAYLKDLLQRSETDSYVRETIESALSRVDLLQV